MREATATPRSARISVSSSSSTIAASSLRLVTRSRRARLPSDDDVRRNPPVRRCHQLPLSFIVPWSLSFMCAAVIAVSA